MRLLARNHEIVLLSLADEPVTAAARTELSRICSRVEIGRVARIGAAGNMVRALLFGRTPLQIAFYQSRAFATTVRQALARERFDLVHVTTARMLPYVWDYREVPIVVDLIDALALGLRSRGERVRGPKRAIYDLEIRRLESFEREITQRFATLVVSAPVDRDTLAAPNVTLVRSAVDLGSFRYVEAGRDSEHIVMTGNMGYPPNVDGVRWFAAHVWPALHRARPGLTWSIVGARPAPAVVALGGRDGITVTGPVEDLGAYLNRATVAIAPILGGAGIQTKVIEAFATGTPVVATSFANAGVNAVANEHLLIADEPGPIGAAIGALLDDPARRRELARAAFDFVRGTFTWEAHVARLEQLYEQARQDPPRGDGNLSKSDLQVSARP
ncbi:MAG: glycosyltransferase [Vulcanimicrobiaceae bacterium]